MHTIYIEHPDGGYMQNLPSGRLAMCDIDTMPEEHADKILMLLAAMDSEGKSAISSVGHMETKFRNYTLDRVFEKVNDFYVVEEGDETKVKEILNDSDNRTPQWRAADSDFF